MRNEIRLSGSGGQGLITAGIILAKAAALYDDKFAVQSQSYGPEARGGASKAEVIISENEINFPKVQNPDLLVALTQEALGKYLKGVKEGGIIIIDTLLTPTPPQGNYKVYSLPIVTTAAEELGSILTTNIITLGALNALYPVVTDEALSKVVADTFKKAVEINAKALAVGKELAEKAKLM
ncbi:MAG: 2-oxoacid:acceptor oxidoreductase family protein [Deferribacteraceae bacterium]|jgi:2-oxoglutarate ferredoxin oxidoreductase subunit gamma|nr:2-oxoacid:acceptor oxidoreductase family protein [Deferribacteraceae bacterium]